MIDNMRFRNENVEVPLLKQDPSQINEYFHIIAREPSTVGFTDLRDLQYSKDKINWTDYTSTSTMISLDTGEKLYWRRKVSTLITSSGFGNFKGSGAWNIAGNLCSLLDGTNYKTMTTLTGWSSGIFENTLSHNNGVHPPIVDASELYITASSPHSGFYRNFMQSNTSLVIGPKIVCDTFMVYWSFTNCTNLEIGPEILCNTFSFGEAFQNCPKLTYVKCLASNVTGRVKLTSETGTFVKKRGVNISGIPSGWTIIEED